MLPFSPLKPATRGDKSKSIPAFSKKCRDFSLQYAKVERH